jgi:lysyl-tRNA synthetase class II
MDDTNSLIKQRREKLDALRAKGIDPFKNKFSPTESCKTARDQYAENREVALAGRITAHRDMGKSMFIDIRDQSGRIQVYAQKNVMGDEQWNIFTHLDLGDFVGVNGTMFTTKTGEISVKLSSFVILSKALRPPPAKWHGLEDTEIRYRQRYLDLIGNPEVKDVFLKRSLIVAEIRNFLHSRGYVEVETPMMQSIPGGAAAQPFKTFHNALGSDFFMRIALELPLKRMLVGGVDRVFEIGRVFRNEGLSRKHNPEFTMLEAYEAYGDYESMMELVQGMICHVAEKVLDTLEVKHEKTKVSFVSLIGRFQNDVSDFVGEVSKLAFAADVKPALGGLQEVRLWLDSLVKDAESKKIEELAFSAYRCLEEQHRNKYFTLWELYEFKKINFTAEAAELIESLDAKYKTFESQLREFSSKKSIDLTPPWRRVKYKDLVKEVTSIDWFDWSTEKKIAFAENVLGIEVAGRPRRKLTEAARRISRELKEARGRGDSHEFSILVDEFLKYGDYFVKGVEDFEVTGAVFEKLIEPTLIQPTFVTHLPKELVPLAKISPEDPTTVEVFECCINGQEIAPAYTEQNDPIEQRERLEHQAGGEQQKLDEDFLVALEHGMPPAGGMGMGIDRLCMMLLGQESIRDVILFPQLKPKS